MGRKNKRWKDHFTERAQSAGYGARSVYKLEEIQRRARVIRRGKPALDLGCAPGSWTKYLFEQGARPVVGVDLQSVDPLMGCTFVQADAFTTDPQDLLDLLGAPAGLVVSDMAPATTGARGADAARQIALADHAFELALKVLAPQGNFVVKVFDGADAPDFVKRVRTYFDAVRRIRPEATRKASREFFLVASGFKGAPTDTD